MSGQVLFNFMNISTHQALGAITGNAALLKKTYLPKYVFTVSKITSGLIDCIFSFGALLIVMLFTKGHFSWYLLLFPIVVAQLYVFNIGLGMLLSAANVFFRDIQYLWSIFSQLLMYMSAIFYTTSSYSPLVQNLFYLNPVYTYITYFRQVVIDGLVPSVGLHALVIGYAVAAFAIGALIYKKKNHEFLYYV